MSELTASHVEQGSPSLYKKKKREELYYTQTKINLENLADQAMDSDELAQKYQSLNLNSSIIPSFPGNSFN